ncbi:hypothetical protein BU26DRAFT_522954 [Trematosphaeria pertusa]|uniref:Uncharacterized protein n=1 Tax=Trematosphaeria pertusa TaxID=390896 RepID=A0A6A6I3V0_9PLEO|nr:uncharacterized protein BU26DRAFT_522954 [Trematosphaeria pertusa]KAF2244280.1 hypothetical protein BU26DRAFT_522954 [Trematosphaeria pertusa]
MAHRPCAYLLSSEVFSTAQLPPLTITLTITIVGTVSCPSLSAIRINPRLSLTLMFRGLFAIALTKLVQNTRTTGQQPVAPNSLLVPTSRPRPLASSPLSPRLPSGQPRPVQSTQKRS